MSVQNKTDLIINSDSYKPFTCTKRKKLKNPELMDLNQIHAVPIAGASKSKQNKNPLADGSPSWG